MFKQALQVIGYKNSGKTTVVSELVNYLTGQGLKVSTIKHDAHGFEWDQPNTDTGKHQQAGAALTLIQSPQQMGILCKQERERSLEQLLQLVLTIEQYDMIIVEGFKKEAFPKLVLIRDQDDFALLDAESIQLVLFWRAQDQEHYKVQCQAGCYPSYPSYLIQERESLLSWLAEYSTKLGLQIKE